MAGGGNRRDEGSITIQSTNLFAALDTRKKKKKTDKAGNSKGSSSSKPQNEPEPQVFWAPTPLKVKSWADLDDDDEDDDYYATTAPPSSGWTTSEPKDTPVEVRYQTSLFLNCCLLQMYQFVFGDCFGWQKMY